MREPGTWSVADVRHSHINHMEHDVICACQVLEQRLKGFERARAWTSDDRTGEFAKWLAMHGEAV